MKDASPRIVLCNGADPPQQRAQDDNLVLEYREFSNNSPNVKLGLPSFVHYVSHFPDRILDLLEIAAYVFCADRLASRGNKANVESHGWARSFYFLIKVRDFDFWDRTEVKEKLKETLVFMSGDQVYHFSFQPGHSTTPTNLFDQETFRIEPQRNTKVISFFGRA